MKKRYYSHLVETESIVVKLNELQLDEKEKIHLIEIMESNMEHVILDAILSELQPDDKILFVQELATDNDERIWQFLKKHVDNIEEKITKAAEGLKKELHQDIKDVKYDG